jgi:hypothetical protein
VIQDARALSEVRKNWAGVETLRSRLQTSAFTAVGVVGGRFPFALADAAHNLPFVHAYAVLNDTLLQLATEGHFTCKSIFLGELLKKSKAALQWQDFVVVSAGAARRNDVAHRGKLLRRGDCWTYVDAVKIELSAWGVL